MTLFRPVKRAKAPDNLLRALEALVPLFVEAAQKEVDAWQPDDEEGDAEVGFGGICDRVAEALAGVVSEAGFDTTEGGHDGDDHAWVIVIDHARKEAAGLNIPPDAYETGSGYSWAKIPDAKVEASDVDIFPIPYADVAEQEPKT